MACFFGARIVGRLGCLFGFHVCADPTDLFKENNPDYFQCCVCLRTIEVYESKCKKPKHKIRGIEWPGDTR